MHILVHPSDYRFLNAGDGAMMEIAMRRLLSFWPAAHFDVLTDHPEFLPSYSPRVAAVSNEGRCHWAQHSPWDSPRLSPLRSLLNGKQRRLAIDFPRLTSILSTLQLRGNPPARRARAAFLRLIENADAFIVTGMGGLTDAFPDYSHVLLDTIELAVSRGIPTVLMGQGLGPFDEALESRAASVLPRVDFIGLREGLHGPRLLRSWGMDSAKWAVTGDDALELAFAPAPLGTRSALGLNVRISDYSGVTLHDLQTLRDPLLQFSATHDIPLRAVPISRLPWEQDGDAVTQMLSGASDLKRAVEAPADPLDSPAQVIAHIQGCRLVVTGSYHAGVFALAQGIPVIGLARSPYYQWKFQGLAHQFPGGCEAVSLDSPDFPARLATLLETLWQSATSLHQSLRAAAERQIVASQAAYAAVDRMVRKA